MFLSNALLKGTLILTLSGLLSRILGFLFRIFLSRHFTSDQIGVYQLLLPLYNLVLTICASGILTILSKTTAQSLKDGIQALKGILLSSIPLAFLFMLLFQKYAAYFSLYLTSDHSSIFLLILLSYTFIPSVIHNCMNSFFLGLRSTKVPAISQLIEQLTRILFVTICICFLFPDSDLLPVGLIVSGLIFGEFCASIYSVYAFYQKFRSRFFTPLSIHAFLKTTYIPSLPLTLNRILLTLLHSMEAILIPKSLQAYGLDQINAFAIYGIFSGMALPCILFPSAITNSLSALLLPTVAKLQKTSDTPTIQHINQRSIKGCLFLGFLFLLFFRILGPYIGNLCFSNDLVGHFLCILAFVCPFLYSNASCTSILNGLGYVYITFLLQLCMISIRIFGILFATPHFGINGYLWSLLFSQIFFFLCALFFLKRTNNI